MVETSLKMPAIDSGTIPARCMMLKHVSRSDRIAETIKSLATRVRNSLVFACDHGKCHCSRQCYERHGLDRLEAFKVRAGKHYNPAFKNKTDNRQRDGHNGSQPEDGSKGIRHSHLLFMHRQLSQGPSKSGHSGGGKDHDDPRDRHGSRVEYHEEDSDRDARNDEDETD